MLMDHIDPDRDVPDESPIEVNGITMNLKRGGSHGYWRVSYPKGPLPDSLKGQYLSKYDAEKAVTVYLKQMRRTPPTKAK